VSINNGWDYRIGDCCISINDDSSMPTSGKNLVTLVNLGPVTPKILWLIRMGGEYTYNLKYAVRWFLKVIR